MTSVSGMGSSSELDASEKFSIMFFAFINNSVLKHSTAAMAGYFLSFFSISIPRQ